MCVFAVGDGAADADDVGCWYGFGALEGGVSSGADGICVLIVSDHAVKGQSVMLLEENNGAGCYAGGSVPGVDAGGCAGTDNGKHAGAVDLKLHREVLGE